jgi:hypothetical protein
MWHHYANEHKGFVIEYDFSEDKCQNAFSRCLYPVIYSNEIPNISEYFPKNDSLDFNVLIGAYPVMIKNADWKYEHEWRVIIPMGEPEERGMNIKGPKAKAIYLGINATDGTKRWIKNVCEECDIELYQMKLQSSSFLLTYEKIK